MSTEYISKRDPALKGRFALVMAVAIAALGWVMMTIGSSPSVKGASFLWLPAALQLVAGVWLGPWWGFLAGGLGAYAAGILAYGGWGIVDIIMNPISGGLANAMLPALLFTLLKIDPTFGTQKASEILKGAMRLLIVLLLVLGAGLLNIFLAIPFPWGYLLPLAVLIISGFFLLRNLSLKKRDFILAVLVAVVSCLLSAIIGALGAVVGGKPLLAALIDPGIGWFAGDVVSAILGLFLLPLFTKRLQDAGIAR
ncbi:MAG: hypothetical protein ABFD14_06920 [Anaerolineaceae bacterium]